MVPENLRYHTEHEWIRLEDETAYLGITHFAQDSLGDIVYLELPEIGSQFQVRQEIGEVESTKTTSPIYAPVSGIVQSINEDLKEKPELINKDPYGHGWIMKIKLTDPGEVNKLMTPEQYSEYLKKEEE